MDKLVLILKLFLANRKMNEVFSGGLSSYSLTMLVVNFFQMHERPDARNPDTNLGVLLLEFFELYGCRFNYNRVGIRIRNDGEYVPKEMLRRQIGSNSSSLLCLEDPICRTNELSRSTFAMPAIQSAFESAFSRLNFECGYGGLTRFKHDQVPSLLGLIVRVPDSMIAFRKHIQNLYTNKNQSLSPANKNPYNNRLSSSQSLQSFDSKQHLHRTHLHLSRPPTLLRQPNGRQETNTAHNSHNNYSNINTQKHYNHQRSLQSIQTEKIQSKFSTNRSRADASYDFDPELISIGSNDSNEDDLITTESDSEEDVSLSFTLINFNSALKLSKNCFHWFNAGHERQQNWADSFCQSQTKERQRKSKVTWCLWFLSAFFWKLIKRANWFNLISIRKRLNYVILKKKPDKKIEWNLIVAIWLV